MRVFHAQILERAYQVLAIFGHHSGVFGLRSISPQSTARLTAQKPARLDGLGRLPMIHTWANSTRSCRLESTIVAFNTITQHFQFSRCGCQERRRLLVTYACDQSQYIARSRLRELLVSRLNHCVKAPPFPGTLARFLYASLDRGWNGLCVLKSPANCRTLASISASFMNG